MRVVTYNIQYWTGMDRTFHPERTLEAIREMAPDIIALQEVVHPVEGTETPLAQAAAIVGGEYVFTPFWPQGAIPHIPGPLGIALISKFPILAYAIHILDPRDAQPPRRLLEVRVELPGQRFLTLYTTHLEWRSEEVRTRQVQSLLRWTTRDKGRPHLVLGDFNTVHPADIPMYEHLTGEPWNAFVHRVQEEYPQAPEEPQALPHMVKAGYEDAFLLAGKGDPRTYTTADPTLRLDYCFLDPTLREGVHEARRWDSELGRTASDHYPLVVDVTL
ncbi:MAG: hypothetical protein GXO55_01730 [Chloroflexi bacterium]|nr:hypothetical protein [Chloroflexota bacterium]